MSSPFKAWKPFRLGLFFLGMAALFFFFSNEGRGKYGWVDSGTKQFFSVIFLIAGLWSIYSAKSSS